MKKTVSVVVLQGTAVISAGADESFNIKNRENGKASRNILLFSVFDHLHV